MPSGGPFEPSGLLETICSFLLGALLLVLLVWFFGWLLTGDWSPVPGDRDYPDEDEPPPPSGGRRKKDHRADVWRANS